MEFGNALVNISLILSIIGIVLSILRIKTKQDNFEQYARMVSLLLFITVSATLLYLYILFITSDLSVLYVWTYTDSSYSLVYKLSGVLAGMDGSLLFWIWLVILPWFYEEMKAIKKPKDTDLMDWTRVFLFGVMAVLLLILSVHEIFSLTPPEYLSYRPDGNGMNPILQTFLMAIHPPIVFVAYGLFAMPFAAGLAFLVTGNTKWTDLCINWSRIGWFFLTLGIGIGALWAYVVLGWGGYWGWDPVETSSLLPWILLTGFLHVQLMYRRKKDYPILAPLLGIFSFILVIFATFATRAGGLWVSVHTFGQADVSIDAFTRFKDVMAESDTVPYYFAMMIGMIVLAAILVMYRQRKMRSSLSDEEKSYTLSELINDDILMLGTSFLLILLTAVTMLILVRGINGLAPENFDGPVGILTLILILVMVVCISWRVLGKKLVTQLLFVTIMISAIMMAIYPGKVIAAGAFPILIAALVMISYSIIKKYNSKNPWQSLKLISAHLIHLAVVLLVIGYVGSSFMASEQSVEIHIGEEVEAMGYSFEVVGTEPAEDFIYVDVNIYKDGDFIGKARPGISIIDGTSRSEIDVKDTLLEDIYIIYDFNADSFNHGAVDLEIKILPLMKCLWGGMWLMSIGIILRVALEILLPRKRKTGEALDKDNDDTVKEMIEDPGDRQSDKIEPIETKEKVKSSEVKDDAHYEAMLEAELDGTDSE